MAAPLLQISNLTVSFPLDKDVGVARRRPGSGGSVNAQQSAPTEETQAGREGGPAGVAERGLSPDLSGGRNRSVRAVDSLSLQIDAGETLALVGESGSGKTVTALSILGLIDPPGRIEGGSIRFAGVELTALDAAGLRAVRGNRIAMIFQEPMTSLNPALTVGKQLMEPLRLHRRLSRREARAEAVKLLGRVALPDAAARLDDYPHQFSGGMRQRVMIAMAVACHPSLVIADEPTTALDVTVQAQILALLRELTSGGALGQPPPLAGEVKPRAGPAKPSGPAAGDERRPLAGPTHAHAARQGAALLLITHDLGVVAGCADRVAVMYAGRIVETAPAAPLYTRPRHPYTQGLLRSLPRKDASPSDRLQAIVGQPPNLANLPPGCAFAPRCPQVTARCRQRRPELLPVGDRSAVACHLHG